MEFHRFFSLNHDPFSRPESPDDAIITQGWSDSITQIRRAVDDHKPVVITGSPGSGKTTLSALAISDRLLISPLAPPTRMTPGHMYDAVLDDLSAASIPRSLERRARAARAAIQIVMRDRGSCVLCIDPAESVPTETLQAAWSLREIAGVFAPPVSLVVVGASTLGRRIEREVVLSGIDVQAEQVEVGPISVGEYLTIACSRAGRAAGEIFSPCATGAIAQSASTISELARTVQQVLMFSCQIAEPVVTGEIVGQAMKSPTQEIAATQTLVA